MPDDSMGQVCTNEGDRRNLFTASGLEAAAQAGRLRRVELSRSKQRVYEKPPFTGPGYSVTIAHYDRDDLKRAVTHHLEPAAGNPIGPTPLDPKWVRIDHLQGGDVR